MSRLSVAGFVLGLVLFGEALPAQQRPNQEPFRRHVFEPELLMRNQREIGLTEEQREVFVREMQQTRSDLVPIQLEMTDASADLLELLEQPAIDEQVALAAAARVMDLERQVKTRHMVLLIRIKNLLTEEQQQRLREIRSGG